MINKITKWIKANWIWLLIIPGVVMVVMKFAKYLVIAYDLELGFPYVIRKKEKELEDKLNVKKDETEVKVKEIEDKRDKEWEKITSGEKKPADIFNELIGKNKENKK